MNRDDIAAARPLADRREDAYRLHFDDCQICPGHPEGECARARELYRSWIEARELPALAPERRAISYAVAPGAPDGYPVWEVVRHKGNNSREVAVYTDASAAETVRAALAAAAQHEDR